MGKEYSVVGRTIHPGMVVDILVEESSDIGPCPDGFRVIIARKGSAYVDFDRKRLLIEAPAVICLNGGEDARTVKSDGLSCLIVHFKPNAVNFQLDRETALLPPEKRGITPFAPDIFWLDPFASERMEDRAARIGPGSLMRAADLVGQMRSSLELQPDVFWPCRSRSYFLELLFLVRGFFEGEKAPDGIALEKPGSGNALPGRLEDVLLHLHAHFMDEIGLEDLCSRFSTNRTSLNALFREHLGMTVIQYLIALRMRFACLILRDTTVPVKEVAYRSGFSDLAHFNRTFKKATSMSPVKYREEYCLMLRG